jgi:hypothetical protein
MRPGPPEVGTASVGGGPDVRIRVHRVDDPEISATAAAFPARSRVEDAPADGAVVSRRVTLALEGSPVSRRDKARTE